MDANQNKINHTIFKHVELWEDSFKEKIIERRDFLSTQIAMSYMAEEFTHHSNSISLFIHIKTRREHKCLTLLSEEQILLSWGRNLQNK